VTQDLDDFRALMLRLWPENAAAPPDPGEGESAAVFAESIAGWLAFHHATVVDEPWAPPGTEVPRSAEQISLQPAPPVGHLDEVRFDLGPEPEGERSTGLGTAGSQTDHTRPASSRFGTSIDRQALLGRLLAFADEKGPVDRFQNTSGRASAVIKTLIADEPLDPLPLPDGVPPLGQVVEAPIIHTVERTTTGESTVTRVAVLTELVSQRALGFTVAGSVIVMTLLGALVWLLLQD
jgi:hypothetical protein